MIYIGVDPGYKGAIAVIGNVEKVRIYPMPVLKVGPTGNRRSYDVPGVIGILALHSPYAHTHEQHRRIGTTLVIEEPTLVPLGIKPGMGLSLSAAAGLARCCGIFEAACASLRIRFHVVRPNAWKKRIMGGAKGKQASVQLAQRMWPSVSLLRTPKCRKLDDNFAEALLIAEYGRLL